ncbi:hypothetical protein DSO57_1032425 [Entomophthora muscae]|uniref:Uncharacterized protein n=1 Tax=Entomophthora muscae TaxID=34485 RepID=A0ACC2TB93_9FUNG|nr:hypothetical protein DSO57_1032425 [Entomophthora muscae]
MIPKIINYILSGIGGSVCLSTLLYYLYNSSRSYKLSQRRRCFKYSSEKVVIIGASSGIGRELALIYAQRGASIILVARRKELLDELVLECKQIAHTASLDIQVVSFPCDITSYKKLSQLSKLVDDKFQVIDTLILNAGALSVLKFADLILERTPTLPLAERLSSVQDILSINYTSFVHITAHLLSNLELSTAGNIVVVSSAAGVVGTPTRSLYSASKHALHGFYNSLRMELEAAASPVKVVIVCPGSVDTQLRLSSVDGSKVDIRAVAGVKSGKLSPQSVAERIIQASDNSEELVFLPSTYRHTVWLAYFFPSIISKLARKKYGL